MKKGFRILAAVLALCLSVLCTPVVSAGTAVSVNTAPTAVAQTISTSKKTEEQVWIPTHGGKKYHSKSTCSGMKDPEKVSVSVAKQRGFTACKKCH